MSATTQQIESLSPLTRATTLPGAKPGPAGRKKAKKTGLGRIWLLRGIVLIVFLLTWEFAVRWELISEFYVSRPVLVVQFLAEYMTGPQFIPDTLTTMKETLVGFTLGAVTGIFGGLLLGRYRLLELTVRPFVAAFQSLPKVALAPMFILWFGIGSSSKIYMGAAVVFFIVLVATEAGVRSVEPDIVTTTRALAATDRQLYLKVIFPAALPSIFAGLRLGIVYAMLSAIVGEMMAARTGLGLRIMYYSQTFQPEGVFGILIIIAVIASSFAAVLIYVERRFLQWQD